MAHVPHTPWPRVVVVGIALAAVVAVIVLAFLWPTATASVKSLPIAVAAPAAQAEPFEAALESKAPGTFAFTTVDDRAAAVDLIETRAVYGAIVLGTKPEVLTASAGSPLVAQQLSAIAPLLQAQLTAALQAQGITAPITVDVTDVVPLASTDARGAGLGAASFPLVLGGVMGGILISLLVVGVGRRVTALVVYAVVGGLGLTGILQGWFGVLQRDYLVNAAAVSLALLAIGAVIVGFVSLLGRRGIPVGPVLFLLIANPIASAAAPIELLVAPWGAIGQWFPPGAAATLLRDLSYFPRADTLFPWLVLGGWAVAGLLVAALGHFRSTGGATRAALAEAEADAESEAATA